MEMEKFTWVTKDSLVHDLGDGDYEKGLSEFRRLGVFENGSHGMLNLDMQQLQDKITPPLKMWDGPQLPDVGLPWR